MEETFEQVYAAWGEMLYRLAAMYVGSAAEAEDVLQDVFVKLLSQNRTFQDREFLALVLDLPEAYRAAVHLHYYEGYSVAEIGRILGLRESAVLLRMSRGRGRTTASTPCCWTSPRGRQRTFLPAPERRG